MIDNVVRSLAAALPRCTAHEIADVIWLAAKLPLTGDLVPPLLDTDDEQHTTDASDVAGTPIPIEPPPTTAREVISAGIDLILADGGGPNSGGTMVPASAVGLRAPAFISQPLMSARAFSTFKRIHRPGRPVVNIDATVEATADANRLVMVTSPGQERGLDIALIIDNAPEMTIWDDALAEFEDLLQRVGAFRSVTRWSLVTGSDAETARQVLVRDSSGVEHHPDRLVDPAGRRLVLIVTDAIADYWYVDSLWTALDRWARSMPTAVIHLLPKEYWGHTALGSPVAVMCSRRPASPNSIADTRMTWWDIDNEQSSSAGIPLPIVALHPDSFSHWAKAVTAGTGWVDAVLTQQPRGRPPREVNATFTAEDRVRAFRARSSRGAQTLARILSAAPEISLPLIRVLQTGMLPETDNSHLAEVIVSGLFERFPAATNSRPLRFRFRPGVVELLRRGKTATEEWDTYEIISNYLEQNAASGRTVSALLANPRGAARVDIELEPFAVMGQQVASRLGIELPDVHEDMRPDLVAKPVTHRQVESVSVEALPSSGSC